jgi:hypothetical protein
MEFKSLNENLYDEFFVKELEVRLETDPLGVGGLMEFFDSQLQLDPCGGQCHGQTSCNLGECQPFTTCTVQCTAN